MAADTPGRKRLENISLRRRGEGFLLGRGSVEVFGEVEVDVEEGGKVVGMEGEDVV